MNDAFFKQDVLAKNGPFFIGFFLYLFIGCALLEYFGKVELHLYFNQLHSSFWDFFFKYFTDISIPLMGAITLYLCIKNYDYKTFSYISTAFLLNSVLIIFVKRVFFIDGHRPMHYFKIRDIPIHLVEGVQEQITYTFPSGHSANAFLFMLFFCMLVRSKAWKFAFFIVALLVAISRIYLSKHFVIDTVAGAALGVFSNLIVFYAYRNIHHDWLEKKIIP